VLSAYLCRVITERQDGVCLLAQCFVNVSTIEHYGGVTAASFVPSQTKTQDIAIPTFSPKPEMPSSIQGNAGH